MHCAASDLQQVAGRAEPGQLRQSINVPLQLALIADRCDSVGVEIPDDPAIRLEKGQVDYTFQQPAVFEWQIDGQLAVAPVRGAGTVEQWMGPSSFDCRSRGF